MKKIPLTQGKFALIDDKDFELVSKYKWCACKIYNTFYAVTSVSKPDNRIAKIYMHRLILNPPAGFGVDHRDINGLNNRRYNLRPCNRTQNAQNQRPQKKRQQ